MTGRIIFWRNTGCMVVFLLFLNSVAYSSGVGQAMDELSRRRLSEALDSPSQMNNETNEGPSDKEGDQPALPNGVDALKESFGDWAVECKIAGAARTCSMGQHRRDTKTGQIVIAIAIFLTENGSTKIVILMPFGLALAQGIQLRLDNWSAEQTAQFATCIVDGETTGTFSVRAQFPNPDRLLLPGMYVRALVEEGVADNSFLVPQRAVSRNTKGEPTAFLVNGEGKIDERVLDVGQSVGNNWLVNSGVADGDRVVVEGSQLVRAGQDVDAVEVIIDDTTGEVRERGQSSAIPAVSDNQDIASTSNGKSEASVKN